MKQETIDIKGLSIGYTGKKGTKVIARDIRVAISSGELTCLLGANGAGKSTLLRTLSAFLDYPSKIEILHLLHRLSREMQKTIFLSTHDLELALQIADQVWLMDRQRGVLTGTPEDLALDGSLGGFFQRKGVAFDTMTGLYRIDNTFRSEIRLEGSGAKYAMVQKALCRNGIHASSSEVASPTVILADDAADGYTLSLADGRKLHVQTIKDLLGEIV